MAEEKKTAVKKAPAAKKAPAKKAPAKKEAPVAEVKVEETVKVEEAPKANKKAKKAEKKAPEAPKKPVVTEARAVAKDVRITPRKARLVIDLVRGKGVNEALGILANVNRAASPLVSKVIRSAAANAINNFSMSEENLYVAEIYATDGIKMKRFLPRAKGSASGLVKRTSHITVVVKER
ncbi:MAG: 50S ribosomal protein L22 [Bacilli bacterium]|nr:50S ribosomal protein L22 [Bacilli bacterium]